MKNQEDQNIDLDTLQLQKNSKFKSFLEEDETVILSCFIWKYNSGNKCQHRIIVLTNKAILNVMKSENFIKSLFKKIINPFDIRRRIPLSSLYGITMTQNKQSNVFVIHVINEHDYHYKAKSNKIQLVRTIAEIYSKQIKKNLPFYFKEQENILENFTLKTHLKEKKNVKPKENPVYLNQDYFDQKKFDDESYLCDYSLTEVPPKLKDFQKAQKIQLSQVQKYYILYKQINSSIKIVTMHPSKYLLRPSFSYLDEKQQILFTPYLPAGTLKHFLKDRLPLQKEDFTFYVACLTLILQELHKQNVVFGNLSLDNIYVKTNGYLMLNGLEQSIKKIDNQTKMFKVTGNPHFTPPEMIKCQGYDKGIDMWKLGILAFYLHTGHFPFYGSSLKNLYTDILKRQIQEDEVPEFIPFLLEKNPNQRITITDFKSLSSFDSVDWQKLQKQQIKAPFQISQPINCSKMASIYRLTS